MNETPQIQEGDTVQVAINGEVKGVLDAGYHVSITQARKLVFVPNKHLLALVEKRRIRKPKQKPEKHFDYAASMMLARMEFDIERDKEHIRQFLEEFAEHVLWHTTPASGNTIKQYQGMTVEQIAKNVPDMEIEL